VTATLRLIPDGGDEFVDDQAIEIGEAAAD
jgi:hypothetical protein